MVDQPCRLGAEGAAADEPGRPPNTRNASSGRTAATMIMEDLPDLDNCVLHRIGRASTAASRCGSRIVCMSVRSSATRCFRRKKRVLTCFPKSASGGGKDNAALGDACGTRRFGTDPETRPRTHKTERRGGQPRRGGHLLLPFQRRDESEFDGRANALRVAGYVSQADSAT